MPVYQVDIRTSAEYAEREVKAATPAKALTATLQQWEDDSDAFDWQSFDGLQDLNGITVMDDDGHHLASWTNPEVQQQLAASTMLDALQQAVTALNTVPRFAVRPEPGKRQLQDRGALRCGDPPGERGWLTPPLPSSIYLARN